MHLLEIASFFPPMGGEFCLEQSRALQARGHVVRVLACNQLGLTFNAHQYVTARLGIWEEEVWGIPVMRSNTHGLPKLVKYNQQHWVKRVLQMYRRYKAKYGKPDLLHAHCCKWAGVAAAAIAREEHLPFYITEHLSSILFKRDFGEHFDRHVWAKNLLRRTYGEATCVIPVSDALVSDLAPFFGRDYRYQVVSNIVDVDFFAYRERRPIEASRGPRICCLARADIYGKGYDVLAKAWPWVRRGELKIAGRGTRCSAMQQLFADRKGVELLGELNKEEVRNLLYTCDALVLPTRGEAQPLVLLEAMATGIPVITTEVVPQSVRIDGACQIVPTGNAEQLAAAMEAFTGVTSKREWSDAVRRMASPEAVAQQLECVFCSR